MALFESYERREKQILAKLKQLVLTFTRWLKEFSQSVSRTLSGLTQ